MLKAFRHIAKGAAIIAHRLALLEKKNTKLQAANKAAICRKSYKKKQIQQEGTLTFSKEVRLTTLKKFNTHSNRKKVKKKAYIKIGT